VTAASLVRPEGGRHSRDESVPSKPIRAGGALLAGGGVVLGISIVLAALAPLGPGSVTPLVGGVMLLAVALLLPGLSALYALQAARTGMTGAFAHGLLTIGLLLLVVVSATPVLHPDLDIVPGDSPILFVLALALTAGLMLMAIEVWHARIAPRLGAIAMLGGALGFGFAFFVAEFVTPAAGQLAAGVCGLLLGGSFASLGLAVWAAGR
jgi:hypothetical protein